MFLGPAPLPKFQRRRSTPHAIGKRAVTQTEVCLRAWPAGLKERMSGLGPTSLA